MKILSMLTVDSWLIWTSSKIGFSSYAVNCVRMIFWSFQKFISNNVFHLLGTIDTDIPKWKTKSSANHSCIVCKVIFANLIPINSVEYFNSSPNHKSTSIKAYIIMEGQSVVFTNSVIFSIWASDNNIFRMTTVADRFIWALIKAFFISRAYKIVHQNW